jgi:hypothetical protein
MHPFGRALVVGIVAMPSSLGLASAQDSAAATASGAALTPAQMETFLLKGKVIKQRAIPVGTTAPIRATLSDGKVTHDAQIQQVDMARDLAVLGGGKATETNFRDSYRYNVAGYRVSVLVGLDNVPMSVERKFGNKWAAFTWWIDDAIMEKERKSKPSEATTTEQLERTTKQLQVMRVFDELIQNRDRNGGNMLWTKDGKLWLIDHTRAFRLSRELMQPGELARSDRTLLERIRSLNAQTIQKLTREVLTRDEANAVAARAVLIVSHFDALIVARGEQAVLFDQ